MNIDRQHAYVHPLILLFVLAGSLIMMVLSYAEVLPEERADFLYHRYSGDGVVVDGPSLLVRKNFKEKYSVYGNYYVDSVSSASIDVVSTASPYAEERTQTSLGTDVLRGDTMLSVGFTQSDENDYTANSFNLDISQAVFQNLTTLKLGYSIGNDEVRRNGDLNFSDDIDRHQFRLGISQILSKDWIAGAQFEIITDEGFLNNPYRRVRYRTVDLSAPSGFSFEYENEIYPRTRTSSSFALNSSYYLPHRAALHGYYRFFDDTWGIQAHSLELGYTQPYKKWTFDANLRYHSQDDADFYNDLFDRPMQFEFLARDKELATFNSLTLGLGATYHFAESGWGIFNKGQVTVQYDRLNADYDNFRDATATGFAPGEEPLFSLSADIVRAYVSLWF